jgi:hypothetical protein
MSRKPFNLTKIALTLVATALAFTGLATAGASPASATSGFTVRLAPWSNTFLFVDVSGASTQPGAAIIQWPFNGGSNQVWTLRPAGANYEIVNRGSGQCLTTDGVAGHGLYQWPCYGWAGQQWETALTPSNGYVYPIRNPASNLYMDVEGASSSQGARIVGWYWNGGNNQYFAGRTA